MFSIWGTCQAENIKTSFISGLGDDFFNEMFPFFKYQDNDYKIFLLPQIKIKKYGQGYIILLIEKLKKIQKEKPKEFLKLKNFLKGVESKDVSIFAEMKDENDDAHLKEAISVINDLGINYKEGKNARGLINKQKKFHISMDCNIRNDAGRIIAKIAFNYFCKCAENEEMKNILFHPNFLKIKSYILGQIDFPIKEIIPKVKRNDTNIFDEKAGGFRFIAHTITFSKDNDGNIVSEICFCQAPLF